jgi:type IV secretion system protein VirB10
MASTTSNPGETPIPDPSTVQQPGITDATKRKIFFALIGLVIVIVAANVLSPTAPPAAPGQAAHAGQKQAAQTPTPKQIQELKQSIDESAKVLQDAMDRDKTTADRNTAQKHTLADLQAADAVRDAQQQRAMYEALHPGASEATTSAAAQARKALFADNRVTQSTPPVVFQRDGAPVPPPLPTPQPAQIGPNTLPMGFPPMPVAQQEERPKTEAEPEKKRRPLDFDPAAQPLYWLPEGTVIEAELTNKIEGEQSGPVNVMVTNDVYKPGTRLVVIPAGARGLGEAKPVENFGQQRLAVAFHRILTPGLHGYGIPLDKIEPGLGQAGESGLHDRVNSHYFSIFGAAAAVGAIGGLAQIGNNAGSLTSLSSFRNGVSESTAQSADRILDRFLNRLPTLTIRPGTRVHVRKNDRGIQRTREDLHQRHAGVQPRDGHVP